MEYKISNRLKIGAIICVVLGLLGVLWLLRVTSIQDSRRCKSAFGK
jgi:hypothetical protein